MGLIGHLLLLVAALLGGAVGQDESWEVIWSRLIRLKALEADSSERESLQAGLAQRAERSGPADPRGRLLAAQLDRIAARVGASVGTAPELAELPVRTFSGEEAWLLAEVLPPGAGRVRAVLYALAETAALSREKLLFAWNVGVDEATSLRLAEGALPIQEALHERYQAAWSAIDLSLTRSLLGDFDGADEVLSASIALEEAADRSTAELWSRRGIATLGAGDNATARGYFGRALAQGSENAALVLGLLDLLEGDLDAARNGFRPSILSDKPAAWALRGWGMTLLPSASRTPQRVR